MAQKIIIDTDPGIDDAMAIHMAFADLHGQGQGGTIQTFARIGDADAPSTIAAAVYSGYRAGVELGQTVDLAKVFGRREHPPVS